MTKRINVIAKVRTFCGASGAKPVLDERQGAISVFFTVILTHNSSGETRVNYSMTLIRQYVNVVLLFHEKLVLCSKYYEITSMLHSSQ